MAADIFNLDFRDIRKLEKFYKNAPKPFARATAGVINGHAFGTNKQQNREITSSMEDRNPRFIRSKLRVTKARAILPISNQVATTGSIKGPRFTGWEEQVTGKRNLKRGITTAARGGTDKGQVRPRLRAKPGNKFKRPSNFRSRRHKTFGQQTTSMLIASRTGKSKSPFIIERGGGPGRLSRFKFGIYQGGSGKVNRIQNFEDLPDKPKRNDWNQRAVDRFLRRRNLKRMWASNLERAIKFS